MKDLAIDSSGDIKIDDYDILTTNSIAQAINIRLRWFYNEWIFGPEYGVKYFEQILVKNPNEDKIVRMLSDVIQSVDEVESVKDIEMEIDPITRKGTITYEAIVGEEAIREEVELWSTV